MFSLASRRGVRSFVRSNSIFGSSIRYFSDGPVRDKDDLLRTKRPVQGLSKLMRHLGNKKETAQYLQQYASLENGKFAVVKIGGEVLENELSTIGSSLSFLHEIGLIPIVVHGAAPQINKQLEDKHIKTEKIDGNRVTTPEILKVVCEALKVQNFALVNEIVSKGGAAIPYYNGSVFVAEYLDQGTLGMVGRITGIDMLPIQHALSCGAIPVISCLGVTDKGQLVNINADTAAQRIAEEILPAKVVFITSKGCIENTNGERISDIDLRELKTLTESNEVSGDNISKLQKMKSLMDILPPSSTVSVTNAVNLPKELFTHTGSGTLLRKTERIHSYNSFDDIDLVELTKMLEARFGAKIDQGYFEYTKPRLQKIYVSENYRAVAIVTKQPGVPIPYLDKYVAADGASDSVQEDLWKKMTEDIPQLFWRALPHWKETPFLFKQSRGSVNANDWVVFWRGLDDLEIVQTCVDAAVDIPMIVSHSTARHGNIDPQTRHYSTSTQPRHSIGRFPDVTGSCTASRRTHVKLGSSLFRTNMHGSAGKFGRRYFSNDTGRESSYKVGLIGARGHTGAELIKIIANHPNLEITVASSRALKGTKMNEIATDLPETCSFRDLEFVTVGPTQLEQHKNIDVWILALPNNLASPFVQAIEDLKNNTRIVDLSADYRFDPTWTYGFPERKGNREALSNATKISNPGCYATGMQCTLLPVLDLLHPSHHPTVFGVSGYSGAGTTPSRKNDLNELKDNLMPYSLMGHIHEREVSYQFRDVLSGGVRFMPHVAPWFRGISLTVAMQLKEQADRDEVVERFTEYYKGEPLVQITTEIPEVRQIQNQHHVAVGGFAVNDDKLVMTTVIDNLLKGAATQCIQNVNISLGLPELAGILE